MLIPPLGALYLAHQDEGPMEAIFVGVNDPPHAMRQGETAAVTVGYNCLIHLKHFRAKVLCDGAIETRIKRAIPLARPSGTFLQFTFHVCARTVGHGNCVVTVYADGTVPGAPTTYSQTVGFNVEVK